MELKAKVILTVVSVVILMLIGLPSVFGLMYLLCDLKYCSVEEVCLMCIRTLQNIANTTGYSYEFWNVLLFIIIEPLICFVLLITTMFKSDKVRFVLGFIIALCCVLLFNYISEHYVLFSKTAEVMMN
ncbi:MAG: hypothetical protein IKV26_00115 [Paludibacteraceae bacterium]|nr:hypothetical protein [Paludibacteraceae bacterium]